MSELDQIRVIHLIAYFRMEFVFKMVYPTQSNLVTKLIEQLEKDGDLPALEWISNLIHKMRY